MSLDELYHQKQQEVLDFTMNNDYFMLINSGAKRTGKTILDNDLFLYELRRVRQIANKLNIPLPQYILAGADLGALQRNVLNELTNKYEIEFKLDKHNRFILFGVQVCCFGHSKINDLGRIRGMTSFGAYINEGSMANREVFDEIKSRCSGEGARVLVDTNPDNPEHWLKKDYIDKSDGKTIATFNYELDDNTFLSERYRDNIKASTPSGMFYDRNIKGIWCTAEGAIYKDFNENIHFINQASLDKVQFKKYIAGVDWGWEHYGSIVVVGKSIDNKYYVIEEHAKQHNDIDIWVGIAKDIKKRYGNISFYCDSARQEYVEKFLVSGIKAFNANKSVMEGISTIATLIKNNEFFVIDKVVRFRQEIYNYVWAKSGKDEPIKLYDDVLDSIRYAIYSDMKLGGKQFNRSRYGV
ncbi:PBSX family phage terminase large subunit [Paraclostridium dentum]|uniref:PBSX family phage terminase large subunit n=1 Tax=Paraclostridium dentum TaxID=2662455 RepID=UPI0014737279|nr:PBSX family phage terminase large subunit [Paraclostridium dentum]